MNEEEARKWRAERAAHADSDFTGVTLSEDERELLQLSDRLREARPPARGCDRSPGSLDDLSYRQFLAFHRVRSANPESPVILLFRHVIARHQLPNDPAERRERLFTAWTDERCAEHAGYEADPDEVRNAATVFLDDEPDATDEDVVAHVRGLASDARFLETWVTPDAVERGKLALGIRWLVEATLDGDDGRRLTDEQLRRIREEVEAEDDCSVYARRRLAHEDPQPEPEFWGPWDLVCWRRDLFVLREGVEAFEADREALLQRWIDAVLR